MKDGETIKVTTHKIMAGFYQVSDGLTGEGHQYANVHRLDWINRPRLDPNSVIPLGSWVTDIREYNRHGVTWKVSNGDNYRTLKDAIELTEYRWRLSRPWMFRD